MKIYTCFSYTYFKKWEKQNKQRPLWPWLTDDSFYKLKQITMRINLVIFFIVIAMFKVTASVKAQSISLSFENASIDKVFNAIEKQSSYIFWYDKALVKSAKKVSLKIKNASLKEALDQCFKDQVFEYQIVENTIVVKPKEKPNKKQAIDFFTSQDIKGRVTDETGQSLPGASIKVKGTAINATSDNDGNFVLINVPDNSVLLVSYIGFETSEIRAVANMTISLIRATSRLDEIKAIAYGTTTQRLSTGNTISIKSDKLDNQPVNNPLQALYGRVPGLVITETNGLPGAGLNVQLRGRTSINSSISNDPLFIIDGVPFAANNESLGSGGSAGSVSPLSSISVADIERIDVLKDADATAIYGSRGSNGVILIQTKRGKQGKVKVDVSLSTGWTRTARTTDWLNTQQYVNMRKEAFKNDNVAMSNANAYDILVWDTTRYTNFKKLLLDNVGHQSNAVASISGGSEHTQFYLSGSFNRQSTIFPGDFSFNRGSAQFNLNHSSNNNKLKITFSGNYSVTTNNSTARDLSNYLNLPPNLPELYTPDGKLNWSSGGYSFTNPLSYLKNTYDSSIKNLISNLQIGYELLSGLQFKSSFGYNITNFNDVSTNPIAAQDPSKSPTGSSTFSVNELSSLIVEPQLDYWRSIGKLKISALLGGTWQYNRSADNNTRSTGYTNDLLLKTPSGATSNVVSASGTQYKYAAMFGRLSLNYSDKYLVNFTGRRDGSSRFGPDNRFSNFGAVGAAYIFTREEFIKSNLKALSYGKLRASYGITGNDKIGDYAYLSTYTPFAAPFQGVTGLYPTGLPNTEYAWEVNRKLEMAIELGFLENRMLLTSTFFRNRSGNQLISYALPAQTGGTSVVANFPALVQNSGLEFELNTTNISKGNFKWTTSFNISLPKNKLLEFPGIATSSYSGYIIGEPLSLISGYEYASVNPATGLIEFRTNSGNTSSPVSADRIKNLGNRDPKFYGGIENQLSYKNWSLGFLVEFRDQVGSTITGNLYANATYPGTMFNQPIVVLDRWSTPGQDAALPRFTATSGSTAYNTLNTLRVSNSDFRFGDASYARLKNVSLSYSLKTEKAKKIGMNNLQIYANAQNLFVLTKYKYADPETQTLVRTSPLKTIIVGLKSNF